MQTSIVYAKKESGFELVVWTSTDEPGQVYIFGREKDDVHEFGLTFSKDELAQLIKDLQRFHAELV